MTKKEKRLRKLIQKPLRFHHQDIHEELDAIKQQLDLQNELLACIGIDLVRVYLSVNEDLKDNATQQENVDNELRDSTDTVDP
jgi:phosphoglycerate-specific signal transduction histidine kinase